MEPYIPFYAGIQSSSMNSSLCVAQTCVVDKRLCARSGFELETSSKRNNSTPSHFIAKKTPDNFIVLLWDQIRKNSQKSPVENTDHNTINICVFDTRFVVAISFSPNCDVIIFFLPQIPFKRSFFSVMSSILLLSVFCFCFVASLSFLALFLPIRLQFDLDCESIEWWQ